MRLKDFNGNDQHQIEKGLSTAAIGDKEAADKILALVPKEWIEKIHFL